ncbi:uncharacterized protein LOC127413102 isoform X1 [Myxocyprinus asiaticus]|uniref:uncharacterized protein LOC127413102 isoform X1 n=1 Tax=Myxocyprinus asiaticus TaxID=70543 RepID=UPI002222B04E|nr:uncharacterized protein LOC127413102 isoform X1 [Myxocyprinus asiaticus]
MAEAIQKKLQSELEKYQQLQKDVSKSMSARQKLEAQLTENNIVKEVDTTVFKDKGQLALTRTERDVEGPDTTKQEDKYIRVSSLRNRCLTCPQLTASLNSTHSTPVSCTTVKRRLRGAGLMGRIAKKKPLLKQKNKNKRLEWAKKHRHWTTDNWKRVLWILTPLSFSNCNSHFSCY